jgi:hypothetical protein
VPKNASRFAATLATAVLALVTAATLRALARGDRFRPE